MVAGLIWVPNPPRNLGSPMVLGPLRVQHSLRALGPLMVPDSLRVLLESWVILGFWVLPGS